MADVRQIIRDARCGSAVVESDAWMTGRRIERPREQVWQREVVQQTEQRIVVLGADQDDAVDTALDQRARDLDFVLEVEVVTREQQYVTVGVEGFLQRMRRLGVQHVVERGQNRPDGARALCAQRARCAVRHVAQFARSRFDSRQRSRTHRRIAREGARHGRVAHARETRNVDQLGGDPGHRAFTAAACPL